MIIPLAVVLVLYAALRAADPGFEPARPVLPAFSSHNDYPTSARVDYVFACMKANGETQVSLQKCSCSIDVIASLLSYDRYVAAQTVLSISQVPGNLGAEFRSTEIARAALDDLRRAQAEAEVRCF